MSETFRRYLIFVGLLWKGGRSATSLGAAVAVIAGLLPIAIIIASGTLIGSVPDIARTGLDSSAGHRGITALIVFFVCSAALSGAEIVQNIVAHVLTNQYIAVVEGTLADAALDQPGIGHLEDPDLAGRFASAADAVRDGGVIFGVSAALRVVSMRLSAVGSAAVLIAYRWWAPFVLIIGWLTFNRSFSRWVRTAFDELLAVTGSDRRRAEYFRGLLTRPEFAKEVRIFGLHRWLLGQYADTWTRAMEAVWRNRRHSLRPLGVAFAIMAATHALVYGWLAHDTYTGAESIGRLAIFVQAIFGMASFGMIGDAPMQLGRAAATARYVQQLAARLPSRQVAETDRPPANPGAAAVELIDVSFTYPGRDTPTLAGMNLHVPRGQSLAIVGRNGAGKSTLIKLLCGMYLADTGAVRIDDIAVSSSTMTAIRRRIAVIFQDFVRFPFSLRDNVDIGAGPGGLRDSEFQKAVANAGASAMVADLPHGTKTVLAAGYENGTDLSGGQWQRVALARALAATSAGANVLVLDEPTAALDVRAETELFNRFLSVTRGLTTILVSHRLSSVRHADRIVVLDAGRIVEDGTHDELMTAQGTYAELFTLQAQRFNQLGETTVDGDSDA